MEIFSLLLSAILSFGSSVPAVLLGNGSGTINQLSPFVVSSGTVRLASTTANFRIPSLPSKDCIGTDGNGVLQEGTCSGSGATGNVSTSTNETAGNLAYWTSTSATPALLGKVATSSVTINAPLTSAGTAGFVVGGSGWTLDIDDIKAADLDLTDITLSDFLNDAGFQTFAYLFPSNATTTNITFSNGLTGNLTGNASTATSLAANGANCSSGSAPLGVDASGAVESCFDVWTEAENTSAAYISNITGESIEDLSDVAAMTKNYGDLLFWNGSTWTDIATSSLGIVSGGLNAYEIATTSTISVPQLAYFTQASGRTTLGGVSTTTVTASGALSFSQPVVTLGGASSALSIADAAADGSTKGAASFTAADFNSSSGNISIDYTNGQAASAGAKGFLTSADWSTFNAKESALTFTYPLTRAVNAISLAFGTTTSNTWAGTQTFTNSPVFTSLTGGLVVSNAGSDTIFNVATTTLTPSNFPANLSGTLGNLVGGANSTWTWWGLSTTTQPSSSNLLVSNGGAGVYGVATTTVTCTGSATCSSFTVLGASPITIDVTAGGGAGSTAWATTSPYTGKILQYPSDTGADLLIGGSSTSTASFWLDEDNSTFYTGQYGDADSFLTFAGNGTATTSLGIDFSNNYAFSISDSATLGTNEWLTHTRAGFNGFGSTTPWGGFSIASSTWASNLTLPVFSVATSTGKEGELFNIFNDQTITTFSALNGYSLSGVRAQVGATVASYAQMFVNGIIASSRETNTCGSFKLIANLSADANFLCGFINFNETTNAAFNKINADTTGNDGGTLLVSAGTTADSGELTMGDYIGTGIGTTTPVLDVTIGTLTGTNASTTGAYIGLTNSISAPTFGCYLAATSTANWQALCRTSAADVTQVDTGIATSSAGKRIAMFFSDTRFLVVSKSSVFGLFDWNTPVADISTNLPTTSTVMNMRISTFRLTGGTSVSPSLQVFNVKLSKAIAWWFND